MRASAESENAVKPSGMEGFRVLQDQSGGPAQTGRAALAARRVSTTVSAAAALSL